MWGSWPILLWQVLHPFLPKCIPVIDVFVKPEPKPVKAESGTLHWAQPSQSQNFLLHSMAASTRFYSQREHMVKSQRLDWLVGVACACVESLCELVKHNIWKNEKKSVTLPHTPFLTPLNRLDQKNIGPDIYQPVIIFGLVWPVKSLGSFKTLVMLELHP